MAPASWTRENVRHAVSLLRYDRHPAATVYDSLGTEFFLALAPGWLNLGLWEGDGSDPDEAPVAVRRLVERLASELPIGGDVLDVGNGLAEQDPADRGGERGRQPDGPQHHAVPVAGGRGQARRVGGPSRERRRLADAVAERLVRRR